MKLSANSSRWIFWAFAAVGAFFLLTEHRDHLYQSLPYLLLLACPLMHFLHGHGDHRHAAKPEAGASGPAKADAVKGT